MSTSKEFFKGMVSGNPVLRLILGLCPALAITTSVSKAIGMSAAVIFVLVLSNGTVSLIRKRIPPMIRIPILIMIIAFFVTIADLVMARFFPTLHASLGIFVPLISVNCIVLCRAEAFASKNGIALSIVDGLGMGIGFSLVLLVIATLREILGNGSWLGHALFNSRFEPALLMILPPGAFFTVALLMALVNRVEQRKSVRKPTLPSEVRP
jgi:electron transport complex protein RnfE